MSQREREVSLSISRKREVTAGEEQSKIYQEEPERDCGSDSRGNEVGWLEVSRAAHTHMHTHFQKLRTPKEGGKDEETLGPSGPSQLL